MTDFQFQLLIGTILGSMLMIILAVVIAARVLYLSLSDYKRPVNAMMQALTLIQKANMELLDKMPQEESK